MMIGLTRWSRLILRPAQEEFHLWGRVSRREPEQSPLPTLIAVRRDLLQMRRYVAPLRDAVNVLLRRVEFGGG